jgi:hypothetical protein
MEYAPYSLVPQTRLDLSLCTRAVQRASLRLRGMISTLESVQSHTRP